MTAPGFPRFRDTTPSQPKQRKPLNRTSKKKRAVLNRRHGLRVTLQERSGGSCEMREDLAVEAGCTLFGCDPAHILPASLGGDDLDPDNHLWLCRACHSYAEDNPALAKAAGINKGLWKP